MRHRGNMLIVTVLCCTLLAIFLVVSLRLLVIDHEVQHQNMQELQLEQLHRTAVQEGMRRLNERGQMVEVGEIILDDEPLINQQRELVVTKLKKHHVVTINSIVKLDGQTRSNLFEVYRLMADGRVDCNQEETILCRGTTLSQQTLTEHRDKNLVVVGEGDMVKLGESGFLTEPLKKHLLLMKENGTPVSYQLNLSMTVEGDVVCQGNLVLSGSLSCRNLYLDGTLSMEKGAQLVAEHIYAAKDIEQVYWPQLKGEVYMPHPPQPTEISTSEMEADETVDEDLEAAGSSSDEAEELSEAERLTEVSFFPFEAVAQQPARYYYFFLHQIRQ